MAAHRYWRLKYDTSGDPGRGCCVAANVEFRGVPGGPDLTPTPNGSAFANSAGFGAAAQAFDASLTSYWHDSCDTGGKGWIAYDFGPGEAVEIVEVLFRSRSDGFNQQDSVATGGVEWSDDGSVWNREWSFSTRSFDSGEDRIISKPPPPVSDAGGFRYWRFRSTADQGGQFNGFTKAEMFRSSGSDVTEFGLGITSGGIQAGTVSGLFDDTPLNQSLLQWNNPPTNRWFGYDFGVGNERAIGKVRLFPNRDDANRSWKEIEVEYSSDLAIWNSAGHWTPEPWVAGQWQEFLLELVEEVLGRRRQSIVT